MLLAYLWYLLSPTYLGVVCVDGGRHRQLVTIRRPTTSTTITTTTGITLRTVIAVVIIVVIVVVIVDVVVVL